MIDDFCWVDGTYSEKIRPWEAQGKNGKVDHLRCKEDSDGEDGCWHHAYYQWVGIVVLLQAAFFYFPRLVLSMTLIF